MNYRIRSARMEDQKQLLELARQFTLLNLPADKSTIAQKIEKSISSFSGQLSPDESEYIFVLEDKTDKFIAGSSQIVGKKGTSTKPAFSFKVLKNERFSKDLGIGFIHQVLRMKVEHNGCAEVGGLVLDRGHRRLPEKLGKLLSLIRFLYVGLDRSRFPVNIRAEMAPPLTEEGRSEFWEALGRRFTGMPYAEADALSQRNKTFIQDLFPEEDIYLALLDSKARLVMGRVAEETQAAEYMLKKIGFQSTDEVDPFDGGPHLQAKIDDLPLVKNIQILNLKKSEIQRFDKMGMIGFKDIDEFLGCQTPYYVENDSVFLPEPIWKTMDLSENQQLNVTEYN